MADEGWMTALEIAKQIGTTEYSVGRAIDVLGIVNQGKRDMADRRRFIYPPGTVEAVRKWLETH